MNQMTEILGPPRGPLDQLVNAHADIDLADASVRLTRAKIMRAPGQLQALAGKDAGQSLERHAGVVDRFSAVLRRQAQALRTEVYH